MLSKNVAAILMIGILVSGILIGTLVYFNLRNDEPDKESDSEDDENLFPEGIPTVYNPTPSFENISCLGAATVGHPGSIHFITNSSAILYACMPGLISYIDYNHTTGFDSVISNGFLIKIDYNEEYYSDYKFEFFDPGGYLSEEYLRTNIYVKKGQWVKVGNPIGRLVNKSKYTHVCWGVGRHDKATSCMFDHMASGRAEEMDSFYQLHAAECGETQEHICYCWDQHNL